MKIRTPYDRVRLVSPSPTGIAKVYEERLNSDGVMDLVQTGEHDLNEFVQASLEQSKVYNILEAFERTQDPSIFNVSQGYYADVTGMPSDLIEAHNMILHIDKQFAALPADFKAKFDNNPYKFYEAYMDGSLNSVFGEFVQKNEETLKAGIVDFIQNNGGDNIE